MNTTTLTRTASITLINVKHVMWRIQSDLRVLRATHGMITADQERLHLEDLTAFVYRGYAKAITFWFVAAGNVGQFGVKYELDRQWRGEVDDESGGLEGRNLVGARFEIRIDTTPEWDALSPGERQRFYQELGGRWGPSTYAINTAGGVWATDKTYGSGALGATRSTFQGI